MEDKEKWKRVFYTDSPKKTKENYKFPKVLATDGEYQESVLQFMDTFIEDLKDNDIEEVYINIVRQYKKIFEDVLTYYLSGNIIDAYNLIDCLVKECRKKGIVSSKISKSYSFNYYVIENKKWDYFVFYRARVGDISKEKKEDVLKHTPFNMISKIGSSRFSIPGQPCLYLGSTSYDCWIEMGKPTAGDFNVGCILLNKDYEIFNLSTDTWVLLEALGSKLKQPYKEMMFKSYLVSQITSYCVNEDNRNFKREYIFSQLLAIACKANGIDGISYISKRVSANEFGHNICMNLALFVQYELDKLYSDIMDREMKIGIPVNYALFEKLKKERLNLSPNRMPYEGKRNAIGDFENQTPYKDTYFYDYDKYLYQLTLQKYKIKEIIFR